MSRLTSTPSLHVKAYSTRNVVFESSAYSVSAANQVGPLDILPGHANLLSILGDCSVIIDTDAGEQRFDIAKGLIRVVRDQVTLFINL
mgnify:CR=1 FL=1